MKYLVILALILVGCSDDSENRALKNDLRETRFRLETCENRLNSNNDDSSGSFNNPEPEPEVEQPKEPEYEEVEYFTFTSSNGNDKGSCQKAEYQACGITFTECKDDRAYVCMTNVRYVVTIEKQLIKE